MSWRVVTRVVVDDTSPRKSVDCEK